MMRVCPHCGSIYGADDPKETRPVRASDMKVLLENARPSEPPTDPQGRVKFPTKELPTGPDQILARAAHRRNTQAPLAIALVAILIGWFYLRFSP